MRHGLGKRFILLAAPSALGLESGFSEGSQGQRQHTALLFKWLRWPSGLGTESVTRKPAIPQEHLLSLIITDNISHSSFLLRSQEGPLTPRDGSFTYQSPATQSNLYLQKPGCKYDLGTLLSFYQSDVLPSLWALQLSRPQSLMRRLRPPPGPCAAPVAPCGALLAADSLALPIIGALLSYHLVVLREHFPLRLCFLAGLFLPY